MIKVKIKIISNEELGNEELVMSGGSKRNKSIKLAKKKRERHSLACFSGGRRRTVDIENN